VLRQILTAEELEGLEGALAAGLDVTIAGTPVTLNSLEDVCTTLEGIADIELLQEVGSILTGADIPIELERAITLTVCIAEALGWYTPTKLSITHKV